MTYRTHIYLSHSLERYNYLIELEYKVFALYGYKALKGSNFNWKSQHMV
ncbi:hypothetical protein LV92_02034 [Arenibacter echinorum]|uniref:Uncharacterized protein n=1 Tax=Arenibacter echinorum TaxID=440515 RepID=A0A327R9F5_9FLAO|nr:hypothetical protein LV92_02034 [Arenibacter echinorum]